MSANSPGTHNLKDQHSEREFLIRKERIDNAKDQLRLCWPDEFVLVPS